MSQIADKTLGRYRLEALIGHGSMADVFVAKDETTNKTVAIKVVHPHLIDKAGFIDRFMREAEALAALRHPNIVRLDEYVCDPDKAYLVMEYVNGGNMEERLAECRNRHETVPLEKALDWLEAVARG
jgi:serine/threonine-protein kinase